ALAARELPHLLLLVAAAEIEERAIGAARHLAPAEIDLVIAAGDLFEDALPGRQRVARLVDISQLRRLARLLLALRHQALIGGDARLALGLAGTRTLAHPVELALERALARRLLLALLLEALLLLLEPAGVVALIGNAAAAIELEDPARHLVEEVAVMGHGDDGAGIVGEEALQPG